MSWREWRSANRIVETCPCGASIEVYGPDGSDLQVVIYDWKEQHAEGCEEMMGWFRKRQHNQQCGEQLKADLVRLGMPTVAANAFTRYAGAPDGPQSLQDLKDIVEGLPDSVLIRKFRNVGAKGIQRLRRCLLDAGI